MCITVVLAPDAVADTLALVVGRAVVDTPVPVVEAGEDTPVPADDAVEAVVEELAVESMPPEAVVLAGDEAVVGDIVRS